MTDLTKHEETLLISILHLKENAYGVYIRRRINDTLGKLWNYGTLYRMLDQLVKKGFLERKDGELLPDNVGRRKKIYTLTQSGLKALLDACNYQNVLWGEDTIIMLREANK